LLCFISFCFCVVFLFAQNKFRRLMSAACSFLAIFFFFLAVGLVFFVYTFFSFVLWHFFFMFLSFTWHSFEARFQRPPNLPSHLHFPRPFSGQWLTISTLDIGQKGNKGRTNTISVILFDFLSVAAFFPCGRSPFLRPSV